MSSSSDVLALLRKCRVLSARIRNEQLKLWVTYELDGYKKVDDLPDYRITKASSKGHFSGYGGSGLKNAEIPVGCIPKEYHKALYDVNLMSGIATYCDLLRQDDGSGSFQIPWPSEFYSVFGDNIYQNMNLIQAWQDLPRGVIVNLVETVKTRVLNFALELESEYPDAGESEPEQAPPAEKVTQIFNNYISGSVGNIASGSNQVHQSNDVKIDQGNFDDLIKYFELNKVSVEDLGELEEAVSAEPNSNEGKFGPKVSSWFGKMASKAASGAWKIGTSSATAVLTEGLKKYYGI